MRANPDKTQVTVFHLRNREYRTENIYPELNKACRAITVCLKPTYVKNLYLLTGIAPPDIRRYVCARMEQTKQMEQEANSLFGHIPARSRMKSRKDFLTSVKPSYVHTEVTM